MWTDFRAREFNLEGGRFLLGNFTIGGLLYVFFVDQLLWIMGYCESGIFGKGDHHTTPCSHPLR